MKKEYTIKEQLSLQRTCAWCNKKINESSSVYGMGGKLIQGVDFTKYQGGFMPLYLTLSKKIVPVMIVANDSPAKKDGNDLLYLTCNRICAESLKEALLNEKKNVIENISFLNDLN